MQKTIALAALALAALAGTAHADDHRRWTAMPSGPQPIIDMLKAGGGTTAGTVSKVAANWFTMTDGRDQIDVTTKGFLPEGLEAGQQVTVVGGVRQGAIRASQIIRDDGTAFGRNANHWDRDSERRHHDDN